MKQLEAGGIEIAELRVSKATLEDVFLELDGSERVPLEVWKARDTDEFEARAR